MLWVPIRPVAKNLLHLPPHWFDSFVQRVAGDRCFFSSYYESYDCHKPRRLDALRVFPNLFKNVALGHGSLGRLRIGARGSGGEPETGGVRVAADVCESTQTTTTLRTRNDYVPAAKTNKEGPHASRGSEAHL